MKGGFQIVPHPLAICKFDRDQAGSLHSHRNPTAVSSFFSAPERKQCPGRMAQRVGESGLATRRPLVLWDIPSCPPFRDLGHGRVLKILQTSFSLFSRARVVAFASSSRLDAEHAQPSSSNQRRLLPSTAFRQDVGQDVLQVSNSRNRQPLASLCNLTGRAGEASVGCLITDRQQQTAMGGWVHRSCHNSALAEQMKGLTFVVPNLAKILRLRSLQCLGIAHQPSSHMLAGWLTNAECINSHQCSCRQVHQTTASRYCGPRVNPSFSFCNLKPELWVCAGNCCF